MPKVKISEYSTTNSNNTDIEGINIDEGCAPSGINNAIRELMVHLKEFQTGSSGDPLTVAGSFVASGGAVLSSTNTISGSAIISGNINSSGTTNTFSGSVLLTSTGAVKVPVGTEAQRPGTPAAGMFRFNDDSDKFEGYNGTAWGAVGGGATGAGGDEIFIENGQTVTTNYTITSNKNALSAGSITINSGVTVTVPSGSRWVIV